MNFFAILLLAVLPQHAQPDWDVSPGQAIEHATGITHQTGQKNPLAFAMIRSDPGDVIQVHGEMPHLDIAVGNGSGKNQAVRSAPFNVEIVGADSHARLRSVSIGAQGGGNVRTTFSDITLDARGSQSGVLGYRDAYLGILEFHNVKLISNSKVKWGYRINGQTEHIEFTNCTGMNGGQEHFIYIDNPKTYALIRGCDAQDWRRTHTQVVTRWFSGIVHNPQVATGNLIIEDNRAIDCGADGAYNYTVAGWPSGVVRIARNYGISKHKTGFSVVYKDVKQMEVVNPYKPWIVTGPGYLNSNGFSASKVVWRENIGIYPNGDRAAAAFNSIEELEVKAGDQSFMFLHSPGTGIELKLNGVPNGNIAFLTRINPSEWNIKSAKPFVEDRQPVDPNKYTNQ